MPLAVSPTGRPRPNEQIAITYERLTNDEVVTLHGIPATTRERATFDAMRRTDDLRESVVVLDMMMAAEQTSAERMRAYADAHRGRAKVDQVRRAVELSSEHSWSPNESRLRLIWVIDALLPRPLVNCSVQDRTGRLLGIADLLDPVAGWSWSTTAPIIVPGHGREVGMGTVSGASGCGWLGRNGTPRSLRLAPRVGAPRSG